MHVHGNHLNLQVPIDTGVKKMSASERGAELRKKLKGAASQSFEETVEDEFRVGGRDDDAQEQRETEGDDGEAQQAASEGAGGAEAEVVTERRTSIWA